MENPMGGLAAKKYTLLPGPTFVTVLPINNHGATTTNMSIFNIFVSTVIKKTLIKAFSFYIYIQLLKIHICISAVSITIEISGEKFKIDKPAD